MRRGALKRQERVKFPLTFAELSGAERWRYGCWTWANGSPDHPGGKMMQCNTMFGMTLATLVSISGTALAVDTEMRCRLYMSSSTQALAQHNSESGGVQLNAIRRGGVCLFEDGRVADKQFVMAQRIVDDGADGLMSGYSVYTFENGDALTMKFDGRWNSEGLSGDYVVMYGTGEWEGVNGTGGFVGVQSPWPGTDIIDVTFNVTLSES